MNDKFQEYKRNFKINCISMITEEKGLQAEKLQQDDEVSIELPEEIQRGYIEVEDMTAEELKEYQEHKRQRNERVLRKMGYEPDIDREWQREIFEINLDEIRGR